MNEKAQQIAIAEACGWERAERKMGYVTLRGWHSPHDVGFYGSEGEEVLPDYVNDLNAMHEAEKTLSHEQRKDYAALLYHNELFLHVTVDAPQRAETFLRVLELWRD
jgi:hypothetical protein